jgi:endo-1,4-beta-xylanase
MQATGTTYQRIGTGTLTTISVAGQPFTSGLRLVVGPNVNNAWDSQVKFPAVAGVEAGDVVLVAFYARTIASILETGEGGLNVVIEHNTTYAKEVYQKVNFGQEWKQYFVPVKIASALTTSQVTYAFHTGFPSQTIEFADVRFINYKQSLTLEELPVTEITYAGQDDDAAWRAPARERINQIRKGMAEVLVVDQAGQAVEGATVSIEMKRHQFGFGTAIPANRFMSNELFREKVLELFNEVVFENDLKWPQFNPYSTINIRKSLDTLDKHGIPVRGHNVIWPAWRWLPGSLRDLEHDPVALRVEIDKHIDEITQFSKGRLNDWDVINEPYSEKDIMAILGNEVMADWFKRVRQNDREVKLYLNDYGILSGGGINQVKQDSYYNLVKYIDDLGGGVDGIGLQGHFGGDLTPITKVYSILDRYAELGKEIKITEHDIDITQREVQAEYTRDFMTIVFSHEAVRSFMFWGFWENSHWRPNAALYDADWTIRPHGEMYKEMVFQQWWTPKIDTLTNEEGLVTFEGFLGTYAYTVAAGDLERSGTFQVEHSNHAGITNTIILSLDEAIPEQVFITVSGSAVLCEGETVILNAPVGEGLQYRWYHGDELLASESASLEANKAGDYTVTVIKGSVELTSPICKVVVNPFPEAVITPDGDLSFCPGGKVTLTVGHSIEHTYTWMRNDKVIHGSVTSIDADEPGIYRVTVNNHGCATTSEPVTVEVLEDSDPACTTGVSEYLEVLRVYPNPFQGSFVLEHGYLPVDELVVELFTITGALVYKDVVGASDAKTIIPVSAPGFYLLKVSHADSVKIFKMVGGLAN